MVMSQSQVPPGPPDSGVLPKQAPGSHFADPAPLGLAGFALTTFVLSVVNADIVPQELVGGALGLALAYGGLAQFAAGIWEFAKGNTFGATAFCSYGGFWISFWWLAEKDLGNLGPDGYKAVGVYLLGWTIFTAYMTVGASRVSGAVLAVFALLTITYLILTIGWFNTENSNTIKVGGYVGIATALAAWYASFGGVTAFTHGKSLVPTKPR
jgi:succinate-acetate transporter protein